MKTLISIIIPHYNSYDGLQKVVKTIGNLKNKQIIIIDDRSDNGDYRKILDKYKETNIEIYRNIKGKKGAGTCRNIGLKYAKSEWITFIDSDDFFIKDAFQVIEDEVDISKKDIDVIFFEPISIDLSNNLPSDRHLKAKKLINDFISNPTRETECRLRYLYNAPVSFIVKNSLVDKYNVKFDETLVANDTMFSAKIGRFANKIQASKKHIYCITKSKGSLTTIKDKNKYQIRLNVFIRYYHFFSVEERKILSISPIPIILAGIGYGQYNFVNTSLYLKKNKVDLFTNFEINSVKIRRMVNMLRFSIK